MYKLLVLLASLIHRFISITLINLVAVYKSYKLWLYHQTLRVSEHPLVILDSKLALSSDAYWAIPPQVFQVWKCKSFGQTHASEIRRFRDKNPTLSFFLYDHDEADAYMKSRWAHHPIYTVYANSKFRTLRADIFRYCVLCDRGGYYFDIDCSVDLPLRSFHQPCDSRLLTYEATVASYLPSCSSLPLYVRPELNFAMWGFGFAPNDPILKLVIDNIVKYYPYFKNKVFPNPKQAILLFTGPGMFTKTVREYVDFNGALEGVQADLCFNGSGNTWIKKSEFRFSQSPSYVSFSNCMIVA